MVDDYKPSLLKKFLEARGCVSALVSSWAPGQLYSPAVMSFRDKNDQTQCVFTYDGKEVAFQIDTKCLMSLFDVDKLKLAITEDDCHSALRQRYPSFPR